MMSCPAMLAVPAVGGNYPVSIFIVVVFPAPFGPRKPTISPRSTLKQTSLTAMNRPNALYKCSDVTMLMPVALFYHAAP